MSPARSASRSGPGCRASGSARDIIGGAIDQHLAWVEAHPNLYRFLAQHAYAVATTGSPAADDAKAAFATELTALLAGYMSMFDLDTAPAERVIIGVVGMVDSTAAWWLEHPQVARADLTARAHRAGVADHRPHRARRSAWCSTRTRRCRRGDRRGSPEIAGAAQPRVEVRCERLTVRSELGGVGQLVVDERVEPPLGVDRLRRRRAATPRCW